ncbi:MAG TPA: CaiB/BaiF CoA-transferase family protein, partial [Pseudorhodoplanes sp.]|nr:CaiB/BaiF CoA-transferase family protein [Pseudorhodoplanes sp.]
LGPDVCLARNPRLVYGRMTGWGQEGPLADAAGHDIAYIALTGALHAIGHRNQPPPPPLNLVGDLGGGGAFLAYGITCALVERATSGKGQVVDAAIVDGVASLLAFDHGSVAAGSWSDDRESNLLDGGTPWYATYETKDGKYVAIGALEPQFYAELLKLTGLDKDPTLPDRRDKSKWPVLRERFVALFRAKTRDEWCALLEGTDACFAPVLSLSESHQHPHMTARDVYVTLDGVRQPRPAPRFSRTNHTLNVSPAPPGRDTDTVLSDIGFTAEQVKSLRALRAVS